MPAKSDWGAWIFPPHPLPNNNVVPCPNPTPALRRCQRRLNGVLALLLLLRGNEAMASVEATWGEEMKDSYTSQSGRYQWRPGGEAEPLHTPSSSEKYLPSTVNRDQVGNLDFSSQLAITRQHSPLLLPRACQKKSANTEGLNKVHNKIGPKSRFQ